MRSGTILSMMLALGCLDGAARAAAPEKGPSQTGIVEFVPVGDESALPEQFRLGQHSFRYEQRPLPTLGKVMTVSAVTFPSPVVTPHPNNNTVHCEYFCPTSGGAKPGVIVLHIAGGDFDLARLFGRALATKDVAALFLKMPYYGERAQPGSPARMLSLDPHETARGMTQAVLDIRQAAGWLAAREEIDPRQIGVLGISLGGITGALALGIEPRLTKGCLLLAGGGMGEVVWQAPEMSEARKRWTEAGHTKEELFAIFRSVDPVTYAKPLPGRKILMLNASRDEVIPAECTKALWRAFGEPEIIWWDAGHYTAVRYLFSGAARAVEFFQTDSSSADQSTAK